MAKEYEIGYGKPPRERQFAKGQSGNPKGRPKGSKSIATMFNEIALELIQVKENGRVKSMTRVQAIFHRMIGAALSGNPRTMKDVIELTRVFEVVEQIDESAAVPHERETAVLQSVLRRMKHMSQDSESEREIGAKRVGGDE